MFRSLDDHRLFHHEAAAVLLPDFSAAQNVIYHASIATNWRTERCLQHRQHRESQLLQLVETANEPERTFCLAEELSK